jgi:hypothetical protein
MLGPSCALAVLGGDAGPTEGGFAIVESDVENGRVGNAWFEDGGGCGALAVAALCVIAAEAADPGPNGGIAAEGLASMVAAIVVDEGGGAGGLAS